MQVNTHTYIVSENITVSTKTLLTLLMPTFFAKNQRFFFGKISTFSQSDSIRAVLVC